MAQARLLAHLDVVVDREWQRGGRAEYLDFVGNDFNIARCQFVVGVAVGAHRHRTYDAKTELVAQRVSNLGIAHHDLNHP